MPVLEIGPDDALHYVYEPPAPGGATFVFFNALTGESSVWATAVVPRLSEAGHGSLVWDMRGQGKSPFSAGIRLDAPLIIADAVRLLADVNPARPVLTGLSEGGLFAARARLEGAAAEGLVLVNALRREGPRLQWINDALLRCAEVGGLDLFRDMYMPLMFGEDWLAANRGSFLTGKDYQPISRSSGMYNLLLHAGTADWDLPYEKLDLPVLVVTGQQDRVFHDAGDVERIVQRMPNARRVDLSEAGHLVPVERPDTLVAALLDFAGSL